MVTVKENAENESAAVGEPTDGGPRLTRRRNVVIALVGGVLAGAGGGFAGGYAYWQRGRRRPPMKSAQVPIDAHNPRVGPHPSKVTLVEFVDFQCPFCARAAKTFDALRAEFDGTLGIVLKHRPLPSHPQARGAAIAVQAAHRQGKAWALHDLLFQNRRSQDRNHLVAFARELALDVARFEADLDDPTIAKEVDVDLAMATTVGAVATPATFVNGIGVLGARSRDVFAALFDEEIAAADELLGAGTPLAEVYQKRCEANVAAGKTI